MADPIDITKTMYPTPIPDKARELEIFKQKYPSWAFTKMVDALINRPCRLDPKNPCGGSDCITEYCATCFARIWNETYPT